MSYEKKGNDVKYRRVSLRSCQEPDFQNFTSNTVDCPEGCVLEILKSDGSTEVVYEHDRYAVNVARFGNLLRIPVSVPTERLWVKGEGSVAYKVPLKPQVMDGYYRIMIPGGAANVEMFGDEYFTAVYELI